jgi:hypothetical protein
VSILSVNLSVAVANLHQIVCGSGSLSVNSPQNGVWQWQLTVAEWTVAVDSGSGKIAHKLNANIHIWQSINSGNGSGINSGNGS